LKNKIKQLNFCQKYLKFEYRFYYIDAFYKYKLIKTINKVIVEVKVHNVNDIELTILRKYSLSNILNNDIDRTNNFNNSKN